MKKIKRTIAGLSALAVMLSGGFGVVPESAVNFSITANATEIVDESEIFSVTRLPYKTIYKIGEELDLTGAQYTADYFCKKQDGATFKDIVNFAPVEERIEDGSITVDASEFDNTRDGTYTITLIYHGNTGDLTATFEVVVTENTGVAYIEGSFEDLTYRNYGDHVEIINCDKSASQVIVPPMIGDAPVTVICEEAFMNCTELEWIFFYDTLKTIETDAFFGCEKLDAVWYSGDWNAWKNIEVDNIGNDKMQRAGALTDTTPDDVLSTRISIKIANPPTKAEYRIGEELDLTGARFNINHKRTAIIGLLTEIDYFESDLAYYVNNGTLTIDDSEFDNTKPGTYKIYVQYGKPKNFFEVTVKEGEASDYTEGTYETLTYRNYGDHIEIVGCDKSAWRALIPEKIDGVPVTVIAKDAFKGCTELGRVHFYDTVTTIEAGAFSDFKNTDEIYYSGSEEDWAAIEISDDGNEMFKNAAIVYNIRPNDIIEEHYSFNLIPPTKTEYVIGEELDLTGAQFSGSYTSVSLEGPVAEGDIFLSDLAEYVEKGVLKLDDSEFDNTKPGAYTIYVIYGNAKDSFEVTVKEGEASDYTEGTYEALTYRNYGDHIEIVGCDKSAELVLIPEKIDGVPVTVIGKDAFKGCTELCRVHLYETVTTIEAGAFSNFEYSDYIYYSGNEEEWAAIEISDDGNEMFKKADVFYDVEPDNIIKEYYSLRIESQPKTEYLIGEELDLTDVHISGYYNTEYPHENFTFGEFLFWTSLDEGIESGDITLDASEFDNTKEGTYKIYIRWDAHDVVESFEVTVKEDNGERTYYGLTYRNYGDHIEITGCRNAGRHVSIPKEIDGVPVTVIGENAFKDCTEHWGIHFYDSVKTIESGAFPDYKETDDIYYSGSEEDFAAIDISDDVKEELKNFHITYHCIPGTIIEERYTLSLSTLPKTEYLIGEELDLTGATYNSTYSKVVEFYGPVEEGDAFWADLAAAVEEGWIKLDASEFDNTKPGTYTIYLTLGDAKESFEVTVKEGTPAIPLGDLDGNDAINATDAAMVLSAAAAVGAGVDSGLTEEQMKAADVDGNGSFDASDASYILAYAAYTGAGGADSLDEFLESLVEPDVPCEPDVPTEPDVPCEPDNPIVAQLCYENKGGYIEITGCQTNDITELVIPAEIDGVPVKSIANKAFQQYTDLVSVSIADGVTSIGDFAFWNCSGLTSITLPDSIENIGEAAFSNSGSLESIHVSENNKFFKSVDGVLFSKDGTALLAFPWAKTCNSYIIPDGVTTVGDYAFFSCKNLNAVIIPTTVKSVEKRAFDWCVNLTAICYTGTEEEWKEIVIANEDEDEYPPAPVIQYNYVSKIS